MKILWVKSDFLHPTTKGGHIRTLEMLRRLRARHEIHYVAFAHPGEDEGVRRSSEYCHHAHPVRRQVSKRGSAAFLWDVIRGVFSSLPVAIGRYRSEEMRRLIAELMEREKFDAVVCDFLVPAPNIAALDQCILFEHNVETMIWRRHAETAAGMARRLYFRKQAARMFAYEGIVCRTVRGVIAVSTVDADMLQSMFGITGVAHVHTGVDMDYFAPPPAAAPVADLVFVGSMDWLPNVDGIQYFASEILPLIRGRRPECTVAIVGRDPGRDIQKLAREDPRIQVTGTVPDVRPYLWGSAASIVPLRIGGGTRLKIFESMAARVPVVSTAIGAEGLAVHPQEDIRIADRPQAFADHCVDLLTDPGARSRQSDAAWHLVASQYLWEHIAEGFEGLLKEHAGRVQSV